MDSSQVQVTPLRISTNVATGNVGTPLLLDKLFEQLPYILIPFGYPAEGILKMEHKDRVIGASTRDLLTKKKAAKKTFFNQSTLVVRKRRLDNPNEMKEVNIKLFANGGIQMTGITGLDFAQITLEWVLTELKKLPDRISPQDLYVKLLKIQLINSDYHVNANIHRDNLHRIITQRYGLFSSLEKLIHQGVNIKYYYNEARNTGPPGICMCEKPCTGQGEGNALGACKKITLLAFQTGDIIVTGARRREQLDEAYGFMNQILRAHSREILRPFPSASGSAVPAEKK
jgi:TATA-box binding protein (TBP) (component of TFIID and TFIIIB)